ncbi:MAG: CocE/NonD family hydrolase [Cyanobacteria bacterium SZAS LIN-3]|nr:CocE/NonD family hydrolase [Cyanobacteria bacterium SZAS LIN-3]
MKTDIKRSSTSNSGRLGQTLYKFSIEKRWLTMPDGVRLAASLYIPRARRRGEKFPVLLEYLPYRKDDTFYVVDHQCFSYFAQLGFIAVKVDIRGTGASEGFIPEREYSDTEMIDCESIIEQLAADPVSNGNVGMFGTSWSGFNSLQMAMRRPPALKAIHAVHASDDLFHDDVHYIDGNLHLDSYHLFINHELGLPKTPDYKLDDEYFEQRFNRRPWLFNYLNNQLDGAFWRVKSLREDYSQIDIPVYLIGGMLDGYRSATVRMFEGLNVPVRCDIGPWDHSCPDEGSPGPNWEWQLRLGQWFNRYLRTGAADSHQHLHKNELSPRPSKEFMVYVRHGHAPDTEIETVPGYWRKDTLPAKGTRNTRFYLAGPGQLSRTVKSSLPAGVQTAGDELEYHPFAGTAAGVWWGNKTGDVSGDDALSLTYDSKPMVKPLQIIGAPHINVRVKSTSEKAKWTVRLEDVAPDGKVMLITGSLFHPAHIKHGRLNPEWPGAGEVYEVDVPMHFTTWTFQPGHKVRLAIANAQFPMTWPSPDLMVSTVFSGDGEAVLTLPVVPFDGGQVPHLPRVCVKQESPDSESIDFPGKKEAATFNRYYKKSGRQSHTIVGNSAYKIRQRRFYIETSSTWSTFDKEPWRSSYLGVAQTTITSQGKHQRLRTRISVTSDRDNFYVSVVRTITQNGKVVGRRRFHETIARRFQ